MLKKNKYETKNSSNKQEMTIINIIGVPWMYNSLCIHLQHILVSVIILKDQSDCGNVSCTDHRPQAA